MKHWPENIFGSPAAEFGQKKKKWNVVEKGSDKPTYWLPGQRQRDSLSTPACPCEDKRPAHLRLSEGLQLLKVRNMLWNYSELKYLRLYLLMCLLELNPSALLFLADLWCFWWATIQCKSRVRPLPCVLKEERKTFIAFKFLPLIC